MMETYQQIHDFTPAGAERFAAFLAAQARPDVNAEACRMECLGVMEDNLNGNTAAPLSWELGAFPEPSPAKLSELRDIEQRIKNDKTAACKMKNSPFCNGEVKAVVSLSSPDCPPGL